MKALFIRIVLFLSLFALINPPLSSAEAAKKHILNFLEGI